MSKPHALRCILVVEDDPAIRTLIVAFLRTGGHEHVVEAGNAEEALFYLLKDTGLDIRLALVDLVLPNASGLALIRRLRASRRIDRKRLPIVVLTGRTDTETYKAAARRGIQGYLMKPVSASLLLETVDKILNPRKNPPPADEKPPQV